MVCFRYIIVNTLHEGTAAATTTITTTTTNNNNNKGTTDNSYIGHSTRTAKSANVEAKKSLILKTALYAP
jgi:hypothetical protein